MKSPAWQFYPKQWLGDDQVLAMDWDVQAMHLRCMCLAWQSQYENDASSYTGACTLPDDDTLLRRYLSNPTDEDWKRIKRQLFNGKAWKKTQDGRWRQEGLFSEFLKQKKFSASRKESADARWGNKKDAKPMRNSCEPASDSQCENDALQSSSSTADIRTSTPPLPTSNHSAGTELGADVADSDELTHQVISAHPKPEHIPPVEDAVREAAERTKAKGGLVYLLDRTKRYREAVRGNEAKAYGCYRFFNSEMYEWEDAAWGGSQTAKAPAADKLDGVDLTWCDRLDIAHKGRPAEEVRKEIAEKRAAADAKFAKEQAARRRKQAGEAE